MTTTRLGRLVVTLLVCAATGAGAFLVGESKWVQVAPEAVTVKAMRGTTSIVRIQSLEAAIVQTAARSEAAFGGLLGLAAGIAGGLASGSWRRGLIGGLLGLLAGSLAGFFATSGAASAFFQNRNSADRELLPSLLLHGATWGAIGLTTALAWAIGTGGKLYQCINFMIIGLLSAWVGTLIYDILGAVLFAVDETGEPISRSGLTRLLARLVPALGVGLGLVFLEPGARKPVVSELSPEPVVAE